MIGDATHAKLLRDRWTWNGCEVYTKTFGRGGPNGRTLELRGQIADPDLHYSTEGRIKFAREAE